MLNPSVTSLKALALVAALLLVTALTASVTSGDETSATMTNSTLSGEKTAVEGTSAEISPAAIKFSLRNEGFKSTIPESFSSGLATVTVVNNSSIPRGVIIKAHDAIGAPIMKYTPVLRPGQIYSFNTYLGSGTVNAMDYHGMSNGMRRWYSHYKTSFAIAEPILAGQTAVAGVAAEVRESDVKLSLRNDGFKSTVPMAFTSGLTTFTVVNNSSRPRGVFIKAKDIAGADLLRYTPILRPGQVHKFSAYLGAGPFRATDYYDMTRAMRSWKSTYQTNFTVAE